MSDDLRLDARKWKFLDSPEAYLERGENDLKLAPLMRQFATAKDILARFGDGRGVLLADDVGLGKTTVGALVAWACACQDLRVRIYAPNAVLRRRWAEELERHVPMLAHLGASHDRIKVDRVAKLHGGKIQVATHHALVRSHGDGELRTACDLMIIDEAHRAKGEGSAFNRALHELGHHAKRKLILTATPFSIRIGELEQLLKFAGATDTTRVRVYAEALARLHKLGPGHDISTESKRLIEAAKAAVAAIEPYVIRHGIDDLSAAERKHFGALGSERWNIGTEPATADDVQLLLRMDRILQLAPARESTRRNDPRFHVGWHHFSLELERAAERAGEGEDPVALRHISAATAALRARHAHAHPKVASVIAAVRPLVEAEEKVLLFCHHRATASELLAALDAHLRVRVTKDVGPPVPVWRAAWTSVLGAADHRARVIIEWLCSVGLRRQVRGWLGEPRDTPAALAKQLGATKPRHAKAGAPSIAEAATALARALLDPQSKSTLALLSAIAQGGRGIGHTAHFPGYLDEGYRTMGTWDREAHVEPPKTLYGGEPDAVIALFNSPFGPDVLVTTDRLSEGVDLHRYCRHLIHYELDPSPVRTLQRNGRVRRVGSWAATTGEPIRYAYPTFGGTRDERAVAVMRQRLAAFGLLLGGVPQVDENESIEKEATVEAVLREAQRELGALNRKLCVGRQRPR
jgi:superfamily II DNA or RNA helicase